MSISLFDDRRRLQKHRLFEPESILSQVSVPVGRSGLERLIPHRDPFLLLDSIEFVNIDMPAIVCRRRIDPEDPILTGHFPGNPIYPGALQGEMIFQACLALLWFVSNDTTEIPSSPAPLEAVATSVDHMVLLAPLRPRDEVTVLAGLIEFDSLLATGIGQILVGDRICTYGSGDFHVT